jgi:KDO2-lipid IV(A) lauroyltransferase
MSATTVKPPFRLGDFLLNLVLRSIIGLALLLPYTWRVPAMGWLLRRVIGRVAGYRARAVDNLAMIWPEMPEGRRQAVADQALDNVGRALIENYSATPFKARMARLLPQGPGLQALRDAHAAGQPVLLLTAHYGNYEAARACLLGQGLQVGALYRPMSNRYFNAHYIETLDSMGGPNLPKGRSGLAGFLRHLRGGGIMALFFDLHAADGVPIRFLGKPARTALSAADLALRYDAPMIPIYATRRSNGLDFDVVVEAPISRGTPLEMTEAVTRSLEARILATPGQWFWIHRRWK